METVDTPDRMEVTNETDAPDWMEVTNESDEPARNYAALLPINLKDHVLKWFAEDCPTFDYSGFVIGNNEETSTLSIKSSCVLAGVPFFDQVFSLVDCEVKWMFKEGDYISVEPDSRAVLATVRGPLRKLLLGKRIALNVLSRCTSIATQTRKMVDILKKEKYTGQLAGTRETTPGFRLVENYGMMVGGAHGHHYDLSTIIFLKAKNIKRETCITVALGAARSAAGYSRKIAVKVAKESDALSAVKGGADIIVLDALKIKHVKLVAWHVNQNATFEMPFIIECSGGITPENVTSYISNGKSCHFYTSQLTMMHLDISVISTSWIHQGVPHIDFSLKINKPNSSAKSK
ncbi:nicotinate-nucleotide pyrophosphorylase [Blumeria hordei DH14]|uniref:nicotinate-nucleotide diphosphorylase (carboxylating) n=1 Tax=Blumeria graminis f. sp. hordei (strain DH14) TaxID=546991 RepID=N1JNR0_BLUG1|nr:nicotinate-nucleotide pyrophosphorylase [Blumeria hordei DH14]